MPNLKYPVTIVPAILATTEQEYKNDLQKIVDSEVFQEGWIHIDFMDNIFVANKSTLPEVVSSYPNRFKKEAHLMVQKPFSFVESLTKIGFERVIVHVEADEVNESIEYLRKSGKQTGLAIKVETPLKNIEPFLDKIDVILIMSINPGFQGQPFKEESKTKIKEVAELRDKRGLSFLIGVDGHVNVENAKELIELGADNLVMGSFLMEGDINENTEKIWEATRS